MRALLTHFTEMPARVWGVDGGKANIHRYTHKHHKIYFHSISFDSLLLCVLNASELSLGWNKVVVTKNEEKKNSQNLKPSPENIMSKKSTQRAQRLIGSFPGIASTSKPLNWRQH
jgi:hypothetical protein